MSYARAKIVDKKLLDFLGSLPGTPTGRKLPFSKETALELWESQSACRHLDIVARRLKAENKGFYTIGSAGHEGNAVVGLLLRHTDPALLHYRSGAFMHQRSKQLPGQDMVRDVALSLVASSEDPISGGRHKVYGSVALNVPPQTSTIASHLPRAVGMAFALERMKALKLPLELPADSIVACSFGDASLNHSSALGAINVAQWAAHQRLPVPVLFLCEDNGLGISVATPKGWVEASCSNRAGMKYFKADGTDVAAAHDVVREAIDFCRAKRHPVFLHFETTRMLGHAGSDVETEYLSAEEIDANEARDPLLKTARALAEAGVASPAELRERYEAIRRKVDEAAAYAVSRPRLASVEEIVAPLAPFQSDKVRREAERHDYQEARVKHFGGEDKLPENQKPRHLAMSISWALADMLAKYPEAMVFGEDVAKKGGVYYCTAGLLKMFGPGRVFNTMLDETNIFGLALGAGQLGMLPCPEIQYLAYYHNAEDQIRGEACSQSFFSKGQYTNPMVMRIASFAYQKGFGGHFHNDDAIAALRDVPGLVLAVPSRADDAAGMLRTCFAMAKVDGRVAAVLEPIALYMTKDLYEAGDEQWSFKFPAPGAAVPLGEGRVYADGPKQDLTIITYGNGVYLSLRAARALKQKTGASCRVLDLRWLNPLNAEQIVREAKATGRALIVDECRKTGGPAEAILAALAEGFGTNMIPAARINAADSYVPLGPAADLILPSEEDIVRGAERLLGAQAAVSR